MTEAADVPKPGRTLGVAVLAIEGILALLLIPAVAVGHSARPGRNAAFVAVLALALFVAAGMARRINWPGWICQVGLVATGLIATPMWVLGPMFAGMYWGALELQKARPYKAPPVPH